MPKIVPFIAALLLLGISTADAANVGVDLNLQIGNPAPPPARVIVREPPSRTIIIEDDVDFIYPPELGFYVGVGVPFDLFFLNNFYFTYRDGNWYRAPNHRGPWVTVERRHLPPGLRKHRLDRIRNYRDREYRVYERERDHYHGRHFRSDRGEWQEHRRAEKEQWKDEKRHEKMERKIEKEERKEDRKRGREDRGNERDDRGRHGRE
ncbi:hypothetical protein OR1_02029 [Geobacter sp. OR-1]|uniref:hypothetical protein n=1 Tax=Geobacter sp. OR-1 TaxID=1266765 RepID=UPI0005441170|nr:hypothetical protein [Geobacter sp. OR-1]GAM09749.1 hypothetical protein OR1_02029 [Geobacter sp. OR-1]